MIYTEITIKDGADKVIVEKDNFFVRILKSNLFLF